MKHISAKHYVKRGKLRRVNKPPQIDRPWNGMTDNELIAKCWEAYIEGLRLARMMEREQRGSKRCRHS